MRQIDIEAAKEKFGQQLEAEQARIEQMKHAAEAPDYEKLDTIRVGVIPGDGIGPIIMEQALRVFNHLMKEELKMNKVNLHEIKGLSIDERAERLENITPEIRKDLLSCHVILKGPMTTPRPGDPWPSLPSVIAQLRRELQLNVSMRPVCNPLKNIDWVMFRENIEGAYVWSSKGIQVDEDLAVDFVIETRLQSLHVARMAFEYARKNGRKHVTAVTKVNIVKLTDGNFLAACRKVAEEYPEIQYDERLVDITASKLTDPEFVKDLEVLVLPNLYGDIVSDVAAEISGGVSTAGSSNIGSYYALFEAIHGSAPFLIKNNRGEYADPSSLLRALVMLLKHIGYVEKGNKLEEALNICGYTERKLVVTSMREDASTKEYTDYVLETIDKLG